MPTKFYLTIPTEREIRLANYSTIQVTSQTSTCVLGVLQVHYHHFRNYPVRVSLFPSIEPRFHSTVRETHIFDQMRVWLRFYQRFSATLPLWHQRPFYQALRVIRYQPPLHEYQMPEVREGAAKIANRPFQIAPAHGKWAVAI